MAVDPQTLFYLLCAAVVVSYAVAGAAGNGRVGVVMLLVAYTAGTYLRTPLLTSSVTVADILITPVDVVAASLLAAAVARRWTGPTRGRAGAVWLLLVVLAVNIARGTAAHGLPVAANEARGWVYLLAALLYGMTLPVESPRWWQATLTAACGWLTAVSAAGYVLTGFHSVQVRVNLAGDLVDPRPVTAAAAGLLGITLLLATSWTGGRLGRSAAWLALTVLLLALQHRTVWVALGIAGCYLLAVSLRNGGRGQLAAFLTVGGASTLAPVLVSSGVVAGSAVAASADDDGTFLWRLDGWSQLLHESTGLINVLFGRPFGAGFSRIIGGFEVTVSPHSQDVETYLRSGLVGCVALGLLLAAMWRAAPAGAVAFGVPARTVRAVLLFTVAYGATYRWDPAQLLVLGTVLAAAAVSGRAPAEPEPAAVPG